MARHRFIVLRHASAGRKVRDCAKEFARGLDAEGKPVAMELPETIARELKPRLIVSSPFERCVQTVEPLAEKLGLGIVEDGDFTPGPSTRAIRKAFGAVGNGTVVCTHGEVITRLFDEKVKCAKGAFWIVERKDGELRPIRYVGAPVPARDASLR
jgi:8-oxo-dGTP diphosphatase